MTVFGELEETNGDDEWKAWLEKVLDSRKEIVRFVTSRLGKDGEFVGYFKGSFNLGLHIRFNIQSPAS